MQMDVDKSTRPEKTRTLLDFNSQAHFKAERRNPSIVQILFPYCRKLEKMANIQTGQSAKQGQDATEGRDRKNRCAECVKGYILDAGSGTCKHPPGVMVPNCMVLKTESQCRVCYQGFYLGSEGECVVAGVFEKQAKNRAVVSRVKRGIEEGEVRVIRKVQTILIPRNGVKSKPEVVDTRSEETEKKSLGLEEKTKSEGGAEREKLSEEGGEVVGADGKEGSKEKSIETADNIEKSKPEVEVKENKEDGPLELTKPKQDVKASSQEQGNADAIEQKPKSEEIKKEEIQTQTQKKKGTL